MDSSREDLQIKLVTYKKDSISIFLSNMDLHFTEKIIKYNIIIPNLQYKIFIEEILDMKTVIKGNFIPSFSSLGNRKIKYASFLPKDFLINIEDLKQEMLYKIYIQLIENLNSKNEYQDLLETVHKSSNVLYISTLYGVIDEDKIHKLHKFKFNKKVLCQSEKDSMNCINNEIEYDDLTGVLSASEVKLFTFHNRNFQDINKFTNSTMKFSKKMTNERMKKVIYSAKSKLFFDEKMEKNNIQATSNPFMKNEWFMGPVYSYNENYKKYI